MKFHVLFVTIFLLHCLVSLRKVCACNNMTWILNHGEQARKLQTMLLKSKASRFAIQQHNNKENGLLEFVKVLKAKEQVIAGKMYYLTLEAVDAGKRKIYEAKIWVKPWMNFKQVQEFKLAHVISEEVHKLGWHEIPIHDPNVKDAANRYMKSLNMKINCLCRYDLLDIVRAETKVIEDYVKFNLLL